MSEYATAEAFKQASQRRFADVEIPGVGKVCIRSLNGAEFAKIKAAVQRAVLAAQRNQKAEAVNAETTEYIVQCWVDPTSKEPVLKDPSQLSEWDSSLVEYFAQKCADHCEFPGLEDVAKN